MCVVLSSIYKVHPSELAEALGGKIKRELLWGKLVKSKVGGRWEGDLGSRLFTTPALKQLHAFSWGNEPMLSWISYLQDERIAQDDH